MEKKTDSNLISLNESELIQMSGGGIVRQVGAAVGDFWKSIRCNCNEDKPFEPNWDVLRGPKW